MPYKFISAQEMTEEEVTKLFEYEDFLKETVLKTHAGMLSLRSLQNRMKKIYVVPTAN